MDTQLEQILWQHHSALISDSELFVLLKGSADSRYARVKRALAKGTLVRIRRGLYGIQYHLHSKPPHPFELAQWVYGPSYVSLESALAVHGLIPEAVYTTTSVTIKRKKTFDTPLGVFSYSCLHIDDFFTEVDYIATDAERYFLATPWKALLDCLYCYKKSWRDIEDAIEDFRVDVEMLPKLSLRQRDELQCFYQRDRVTKFIKSLSEEWVDEH